MALIGYICFAGEEMKLVKHVKETEYDRVQKLVHHPDITQIEFAIWEHRGHFIEVTEDNFQMYVRINSGIAYTFTDLTDAAYWIANKLNGEYSNEVLKQLVEQVGSWTE